MKSGLFVPILLVVAPLGLAADPLVFPDTGPDDAVLETMRLVCDWQMAQPNHDDDIRWTNGALYTGIMATYEATKESRYVDNARNWSERFKWQLGSRMRHADDHCCGQTYLELFLLDQAQSVRYKDTKSTFDTIRKNPVTFKCKSGSKDFWQWCDALFMAPPVLTRLHHITGDSAYLTLMHEMWNDTYQCLYDQQEDLYYRDHKYFDDRVGGKKVFWGRGNGWVIGGLVRVLQMLPPDDPQRDHYETLFVEMCTKLATLQGSDGFWRSNLLHPIQYPNPESSGTSFFCYGFAWGINEGLLDRVTFGPVAEAAWNGLVQDAVHPNGKLGYVQNIGSGPKGANYDSTHLYAVGAFLLAGSEMLTYYRHNKEAWIDTFESYRRGLAPSPGRGNRSGAVLTWQASTPNADVSLHGVGNQALKLNYDNGVSPHYAACEYSFPQPRNLTAQGAQRLSFYLKGDSSNASDSFFFSLVDASEQQATQRLDDINILRTHLWHAVHLDLSAFHGIDLSRIKRIILGVGSISGNGVGRGVVVVDDVHLGGGLCLAGYQITADLNMDCHVDGRDYALWAQNWQHDTATVSPPPDSEIPGLRCHYRLDEIGGSTALDETGNYPGILQAADWAPEAGYAQGAARIQGHADLSSRIDLPTAALSKAGTTIAFWTKLDSNQTYEDVRYFFGHNKQVTSKSSWGNRIQLYMDKKDLDLDLGLGDSHTRKTGIVTLKVETWTHLALSWDGSQYAVYVNGKREAQGSYKGLDSFKTAHIGNNGANEPEQALNGLIDDFRIYNRSLSPAEVTTLAHTLGEDSMDKSPSDLNQDGLVDMRDLQVLSESWLETSWP